METVRLIAGTSYNQALLDAAPTLAAVTFSNTLASGEFLVRTQLVTLPVNGPSGDTRLAVTIDARDEIFEANETNNTALAVNSLRVPVALTLQASSGQISEESTVPVRITLSRNGATSQSLAVAVSNSHPADLSFLRSANTSATTNLAIPAGRSSIEFDLYARPDGVPDADQPVMITAGAAGYSVASAR
jgi:hypothetical protein